MKNKINLLMASLVATCLVFIYLTMHHFAVKAGVGGSDICNLSGTLNCDAAAMSSFAEVAGIPVAVLGLCFSGMMLGVVAFFRFSWIDDTPFLRLSVKTLFGFSAVVSIIMAVISVVFVKAGCPFCMASYVLSFINLYLALKVFQGSSSFEGAAEHKGLLTAYIFIPILAWMISSSFQDQYQLNEIKKMVPEKVSQWQNSPEVPFAETGIVSNPQGTKATIVEFADFKCPHCKAAFGTLHKYISVNKDIKFIFKPLPLDGVCNTGISFMGDGSRCRMAAWSLCSEKLFQKGLAVQEWYFDRQEALFSVTDLSVENKAMSEKIGMNYDEVEKCSTSVETQDQISKIVAEANVGKVEGTPTIFVNGKKLTAGQKLDILQGAISTLK